jgi:hypothetical protein
VQYPSGGSGAIQYQWLQLVQIGQSAPNWVAVPGATGPTYQPGPLSETSYFMRCARRDGCTNFLESNIVTITVQPAGTSSCPDFTDDLSTSLVGPSTVSIKWATVQPEIDQYMYSVQHSTDMTEWELVTVVPGENNPSQPSHYEVLHQTPVSGINYYRLKRVNENGVTTFSKIKSIDLAVARDNSILIVPNPVSDALIIKNIVKYETDVPVEIINTNGDILQTMKIEKETLHYESLPVSDLPSGLYMVRIRFPNGDVRTVKITKF